MVGMAVALAVVTVLAWATICATSPCSNVNWTLRNYVQDFTADSCLYIRRLDDRLNWNKAKEMCESLDHPYPNKWHLVEPRTSASYDNLKKILGGVFGRQSRPLVWIGLVRYVVENRDQLNRQIWADQSKWLWDSDNSSLLSTFSEETPWGHGYPRLWDQQKPKVCVNLFRHTPTDQFMFNDDPCESEWPNQAIACELIDNSTTTTTTSTTTTTMTQPNATVAMIEAASSSPDSESSPWMWVGIVLAIIVVLAVVAFLAYRAVQHRRKREPFMLSADSDQSGTYENMPRYKGKRRPMKKVCDDDSVSEALDTSKVSSRKMVCKAKKPKLSWMIDRKDEPKSPVLVQVEGKAASPKLPEGKAVTSKQLEGKAERKSQKENPKEGKPERKSQKEKPKVGKAESESLKIAVMKKS